jgi:hypothetical protein
MHVLLRLLIGPLAVAALAAIRLAPQGALAAATGATVTFALAHAAVVLWDRRQLQRSRRRSVERRRLRR